MSDQTNFKQRVKALLKKHRGPVNCITMSQVYIDVTGDYLIPRRAYNQTRRVRNAVNELRHEGCPIAHKNGAGGGYFWANANEMAAFVKTIQRRNANGLMLEAALLKEAPMDIAQVHYFNFLNTKENDGE